MEYVVRTSLGRALSSRQLNCREFPLNFLKGKVMLPENDAQLKHIFRDKEGHLLDTSENRKLLLDLANDIKYHVGNDKWGNDWNVRLNDDGTQDWVRSMSQVINEGGRNPNPKPWNSETGLYQNIWRDK